MNAAMRKYVVTEAEDMSADERSHLEIQVAELRADVRHVQSDMTEIKAELHATTTEIKAELHTTTTEIRAELHTATTEIKTKTCVQRISGSMNSRIRWHRQRSGRLGYTSPSPGRCST